MKGDWVKAIYKKGIDEASAGQTGYKKIYKNVEGKVIFENAWFITIATEHYNTSVNKRASMCGEVNII